MNKVRNKKNFIVGALFLSAALLGIIPFLISDNNSLVTIFQKKISYKPITKNLSLLGKSAFLYDVSAKQDLYKKNEDIVLPLASVTKIMSAFVASKLLPEDALITITEADLALPEDHGLLVGEEWRLYELLPFALVVSSNDAFNAIGKEVERRRGISLVDAMNLKAKELGLTHTTFYNETGLDMPNGKNGGYSTCREVALLLSYVYGEKKTLFEKTAKDSFVATAESGMKHTALNTDILAAKIPWLRAGKTGLTPRVGGSLAVLVEPRQGQQLVACVLGSTEKGRFTDIETLLTSVVSQPHS